MAELNKIQSDTQVNGNINPLGNNVVSTNIAIGHQSLNNATGANNTAIGYQSLVITSTGSDNTAVGYQTLYLNTGSDNTAIGYRSLYNNTSGINNTGIGHISLLNNAGGINNAGIGCASLEKNTSGDDNTAIGYQSLGKITSGDKNVGIGKGAGFLVSSGAANEISTYSIYLGYDTRPNADGDVNEIVIGHTARGNGSNTVTLGNSSIVNTYLQGEVVVAELLINDVLKAPRLSANPSTPVGGQIYYNTTTSKLRVYNDGMVPKWDDLN